MKWLKKLFKRKQFKVVPTQKLNIPAIRKNVDCFSVPYYNSEGMLAGYKTYYEDGR